MQEQYTPVSLKGMKQYQELLVLTQSNASDYSFANIWGWAPHYSLEWRFDGTLCWIRQHYKGETQYWAPVGPWENVTNWQSLPELQPGSKLVRAPEHLVNLLQANLGDSITIEEDRAQWDYLYLAQDLMTLSGNKFHKKKNRLNQFEKAYTYEYRSLSSECVETVLNMQTEWCKWNDCEGSEALLAENDAVARVLMQWNTIPNLCGGIIRIDGTPVAYTIGEMITPDTLVVHFEKAAPNIRGSYQAINYLFAGDAGKNVMYINREQDLGDEGLRQAKLTYNPVDFVKKYTVTVNK